MKYTGNHSESRGCEEIKAHLPGIHLGFVRLLNGEMILLTAAFYRTVSR